MFEGLKLHRVAAMTVSRRSKPRGPAMRITDAMRNAKQIEAAINQKLAAEQAELEKRKAVMAALKKAASYWTHERLLRLTRHQSRNVAMFLQKVNAALLCFQRNSEKTDIRMLDFLPFWTTRAHFREELELREVSQLIGLPIEKVEELCGVAVHPLPDYVARLHPKYKD